MASDAVPTLAEQILKAPEDAWRKLSQALHVETREEAVQLIAQDEQAAATAKAILMKGSALTNAKAPRSALTIPSADIPTGSGKPPKMGF